MFALPVSGVLVGFRECAGADELFLAERPGHAPPFRIEVARRLSIPQSGQWDDLPYADIDAALVGWHRHSGYNDVSFELSCTACGERGEVTLPAGRLLAESHPNPKRGVTHDADGYWHDGELRFRIPLVRDVAAEFGSGRSTAEAATALRRVCAPDASPKAVTRIGRLLERLAPPMARLVRGTCPACGAALTGWLDPGAIVIAALQVRASAIFEEIHLIAGHYGWSEEAILGLPAAWRRAYAALIAGDVA